MRLTAKYLILFVLLINGFIFHAQLNVQEKILRDSHIKKIFVYTFADSVFNKQLSTIKYLNDSGLVIRLVTIKGADTITTSVYEYDNENRIISEKSEYDGKTYETTYIYPEPHVKITMDRSENKLTATTTRSKVKKHSEIQYEYASDKLVRKIKFRQKRYGFKVVYKTIGESGRNSKESIGKEYFNADKNIIKSVYTSSRRAKINVGGYTRSDSTGKIIQDKLKYKTIKHTTILINTFEYNSLKLLSKLTEHPVQDFVVPGYHYLGRERHFIVYEYFK